MTSILKVVPTSARAHDVTRFFHPVMPAVRLRKASARVVLDGTAYALWRDASGKACAVVDVCPHRLAPLSQGFIRPDGRLACAYHGWHFGADGAGAAPTFPNKKCSVLAAQVVERAGYLWLASSDLPLTNMPDLGEPDYELAGAVQTRFATPLHVALDNFSENEHVPWVHSILGWDETGAQEVQFECTKLEDRSIVSYRGPQRPHPTLPLFGLAAGDTFHNEWETRFDPVCARYKLTWFARDTGEPRPLSALFRIFMVPETARSTIFHTFVYTRLSFRGPRLLRAAVDFGVRLMAAREIAADAKFVAARLATAPIELTGMHPSPWDKPVVYNRKLLQRVYRGEDGLPAQ